MKRISIYFNDGKSLAFNVEVTEYEALIKWLNENNDTSCYKLKYNMLEYYIRKNSIEYIIA